MRNKKADLSLSINAIVILILAITMLGLGLTFMRGLFKQATEKVEAAVSAQELVNPPTIDNPLTVAPSELTLRKDKQDKIVVAFLGPLNGKCQLYVTTRGETTALSTAGIGGGDASLVFNGALIGAKVDQINTWTVSIKAGNTEGTKLFTLKMDCGETAAGANLVDTEVIYKFTKDIIIIITA